MFIYSYCIWHEAITVLNGNHGYLSEIMKKYFQLNSFLTTSSKLILIPRTCLFTRFGLFTQAGQGLKLGPIFWGLDPAVCDLRQLWTQMAFDDGKWLMAWHTRRLLDNGIRLGLCIYSGARRCWEKSPGTMSWSKSSHCKSATCSGMGKITSPGEFFSGHFMKKNWRRGVWDGGQGAPGYSRASEVFLLEPCQQQTIGLCFVPLHRSENTLGLGFHTRNA